MMTAPAHNRDGIIEELLTFLDDDDRATLERSLRAIAPTRRGKKTPDDWRSRVKLTFPRYASEEFADFHAEAWDWANAIELESAPRPFTGFWFRGAGKSTSIEMITTDLGCRDKRRYILYVRMTQEKADASVENIAALLESKEIARYYPEHAKRKVGKYGNAKGWRRNRVWTAGGFAVDALGLDTASRGVKLEDQRPDMIIFDDIDSLTDSPAMTAKKREIITKSIIPAGSKNCAIVFIQNLIIRDGIASTLADGRADFLANRIVSGPFPAVRDLKYTWVLDQETGTRRPKITAGTATWSGFPLEAAQRAMENWGPSSFLKEAQHDVYGRGEGVSLNFDPTRHYVDLTDIELRLLVARGKCFAGVDPQWWRFGFTMWTVLPTGVVYRVAEYFSQKEILWQRAKRIHDACVALGIDDPSPKTVPIWADAANPQDIAELNAAFKTGWVDEGGQLVTSKLRVVPVANENKLRRVAVQRINNALDKDALLFVRSVGQGDRWLLGQNANSAGTETHGSRLMWEIDNWAVIAPKEGEAQDENPDDDSADGADMIASMRYALMSFWKVPKEPAATMVIEDDRAEQFDYQRREFKEYPHASDELELDAPARRRPFANVVRPRVGR